MQQILALILVFDTNGGASNTSGQEALALILSHCELRYLQILEPKTHHHSLICDETASFNKTLVLHLTLAPAWPGPDQCSHNYCSWFSTKHQRLIIDIQSHTSYTSEQNAGHPLSTITCL